jgi:DNA-nicking Smr family endonuclease
VAAPRRLTLKERLRRYPAPQAQLDLHGATALEARQRTEVFMRSARTDGLFTVRVIVGKGLHSEGGAVLPDVIEELLLALKRTGTVLTYRWEKDIKRKSGAVIVYLSPP